jgi:hypothetical protein
MASTPPTKKRKIKQLPNGLSQLTESNFRKVMAFRLEMDSHEKGEVMVATTTLPTLKPLTWRSSPWTNSGNSAGMWRSICQQMRQISVQEGTVDSCKSPGPEGKGRCTRHHCIRKFTKQQHWLSNLFAM